MTRELHPWELPLTEELARQFHDATNFGTMFSPERWRSSIESHAIMGRLGAFGMFHDGKLVGMLVGIVAEHFMAEALVAQELMWWVSPDNRRSLDGIRLKRLFEGWAKRVGADGIVMARLAASADDNRLDKFYRRQGFQEIESHYLKVTPWQSSQQPLSAEQPLLAAQ